MDLLVTSTGDLAIVDGELAWVTGQDAIAQHIAFRLRTFLNESRYNLSAGVPWTQVIFRPGTPPQSIKFILGQTVMETPGVTGCTLNEIIRDPETRAATVSGTATTIEGEVQFLITVGGPSES
jgi:hypothetical protein